MDKEFELYIDAFLETARISVIRDGARLIILDPWNELEHKRGRDETTTDYIGSAISKVKAFAKRYNVASWIVAHPTKPQKDTNQIPPLYDVSDPAHRSEERR